MTDEHGKGDQSGSKKRPYHRPRLFIYGDVNKLTRASKVNSTQPLDGKTQAIGGGRIIIRWRS